MELTTNKKFFENSLGVNDLLKEPTPINHTLKGLPVNECSLLVAPGAVGKSFFVLNLMLACTGLTQNHLVESCFDVLYVSLEDTLQDIQRRLHSYKVALGITEEQVKTMFYKFDIVENKSTDRLIDKSIPQNLNPMWQELNAKIQQGSYKLVIIDTLIKSYVGFEENNNADMSMVLSHFNNLARDNNCSVMLLHHTNKGAINPSNDINQSISRGASSLVDNSRFVLSLSKNEDNSGVICQSVKSNHTAPTSQEYMRDYKGALVMSDIEDLDNAA